MMRIINAYPGDPMAEEEIKNFLADNNNNLLICIGLIDEKGEPNVIPTGYYFDDICNKIYITTHKTSKKSLKIMS